MSSLISRIIDFIAELIQSVEGGYLFFGSGFDIIRYACDIILVAVLFYYILLFIRQTRAWQLIKGIILILVFVLICSFMGLEMVGFLFNRLLYVFAFLFIVIFQPELRRALETVGLRSFGSVRSIFSSGDINDKAAASSLIHEICLACKEMSRTYTGALILIERNTKLDELLTQENVVRFDSTVSNSVLQSIFYKGSPMHDGGLLIRDGRIIAARCHVPLSVTMHNLERSGTRHRAAVGASEMGDTVVVVVSEERGKTSIAVNGRLYEMKNSNELEANLAYLLGVTEDNADRKGINKVIDRIRRRKKPSDAIPETAAAAKGKITVAEEAGEEAVSVNASPNGDIKKSSAKVRAGEKAVLIVLSLILSVGLWIYIQITNNPVISKSFVVPISYSDTAAPANMEVSYPIDSVDVTLVGRKETIEGLTSSDIIATIDYSAVTNTGVTELPIIVTSADPGTYFRVEQQVPDTISVTVYSQSNES